MKKTYQLTASVKALVVTVPLAMAPQLFALEKPPEKAADKPHVEQAPKGKVGEADVAEKKPAKAIKKVAMLGIGGNKVSETLSLHLGLAENTGLTVYHVVPDSAAEKAGIKTHDIIMAINDQPVGSQNDLRAAILAHEPEDQVTVKIISKGKVEEKKVTLGDRIALPRRGVMPMRGAGNDLFKMLQGMGGNIPEADRARMEEEMRKHVEQLQKQFQNGGGLNLDPDGLRMRRGIHMLGGTSVSLKDAEGSVTMKTKNGKKEVIVKDKAGQVIFEGPYDTEQDRAAVPDSVAERIKRLDFDMKDGGLRLRVDPGRMVIPPVREKDKAAE